MPDFYIERALDVPLSAVDERLLRRKLEVWARIYRVRWGECLVDSERQRIVCRVEAEDLSAARTAARCLGAGPRATWLSALPLGDTTTDGETNGRTSLGIGATAASGLMDARTECQLVDVLAEWQLDAPIDLSKFVREQIGCDRCLEAWRVRTGPVAASADGRRLVAFLRAPDAEAVRNAYRHATVPFDRVIALRRLDG